jgi:hypothetical protein
MNANTRSQLGLSRRSKVGQALWLVLSIALLGLFVARAEENPEAEKLLNAAKERQIRAQRLRADANAKLQEAADEEVTAREEDRQGNVFTARALQLMKADANQQRAFQLRQEARTLWADSHRKAIQARNSDIQAAKSKSNSEALMKAAAEIKDQPNVALSLQNDAKAQAALGQREAQSANADRTEAENLEKRADGEWGEAEKLDPAMQAKLAPKPEKPEMHPGQQPR